MYKFEAQFSGLLDEFLKNRLKKKLPGKDAQYRMAGIRHIEKLFPYSDISSAKQSSVLILLYPHNNLIHIVLTRRTEYDGIHSGQISLPGGSKENTDTSLMDTALRESFEETGIIPEKVKILGKLSELYIPPSNFLVTPYIGSTDSRPDFYADPVEVAEIIEIPVNDLINPLTLSRKKVKAGPMNPEVPCYYINDNIIWGATAMILSELVEILNEFKPYSIVIE